MHPLQAAVTALLLFSVVIILMTAYQASTEVVPDLPFLSEPVFPGGRRATMAEEAVRLVDEEVKGLHRVLFFFSLRHAREYLGYGALGPAVYEASRVYRLIKKLSRTTSR